MNILDDLALKGLPILLTDFAATWWQGVKATVTTWNDAVTLLKHTYTAKKSAYRIYRELFSLEHNDNTPTDIFVCQCRVLLAQLPSDALPESTQIDMVYGLLSPRIRKEVSREKCTSFSKLLDLTRVAEENMFEFPPSLVMSKNKNQSVKNRPKCKYCKNFGHLVEDCRRLQKNKKEQTILKTNAPITNETPSSSQNETKIQNNRHRRPLH